MNHFLKPVHGGDGDNVWPFVSRNDKFHYDVSKLDLDLHDATGTFTVHWFDPRNGGAPKRGTVAAVDGGSRVALGMPPDNRAEDWLVVVRRVAP